MAEGQDFRERSPFLSKEKEKEKEKVAEGGGRAPFDPFRQVQSRAFPVLSMYLCGRVSKGGEGGRNEWMFLEIEGMEGKGDGGVEH